MRNNSDTQMLSYPIRLPDPVQEEALRLLELSCQVINATLVALWPRLDEFGTRESTYAYKQVTAMLEAPVFSGDRLWRCQAEQAGRILRSQAQRKQQFALILPLLSQGMIRPKTEKQPAGKARKVIKAALSALREPDWRYGCRLRPLGAASSLEERCSSMAGSPVSRCIPLCPRIPCCVCADSSLLPQLDLPRPTPEQR